MSCIASRENNFIVGTQPRKLTLLFQVLSTASSLSLNGTNTRTGVQFNAGSPWIGKTVRRMGFLMRKSAAGAPYFFTIRDTADAVQFQSPTFDATPLTTTYAFIAVDCPPTVIQTTGHIQVESPTADATNLIILGRSSPASVQDSNTVACSFAGSYTTSGIRSASITLWS